MIIMIFFLLGLILFCVILTMLLIKYLDACAEYQYYLAHCCKSCGALLEPGETCGCSAFMEKEREEQVQKEEKQ